MLSSASTSFLMSSPTPRHKCALALIASRWRNAKRDLVEFRRLILVDEIQRRRFQIVRLLDELKRLGAVEKARETERVFKLG
jgi:hypothetical protein